MAVVHATPYGIYENFSGFYFSSLEEYESLFSKAHRQHGCEEYEIQFINGDDHHGVFFDWIVKSSANPKLLERFFTTLEKTTKITKLWPSSISWTIVGTTLMKPWRS